MYSQVRHNKEKKNRQKLKATYYMVKRKRKKDKLTF